MNTWEEIVARPAELDPAEIKALVNDAFNLCLPDLKNADDFLRQTKQIDFGALIFDLLQTHFGSWIQNWGNSASGGGLISNWCCPQHSMLISHQAERNSTVNQIVAAVTEWHELIGHLEALFTQWSEQYIELPLPKHIENVAAHLVDETIRLNTATDAWFGTMIMLLEWYFDSVGIEFNDHERDLHDVCEGHFESWVAPSATTKSNGAREIGQVVASSIDSLPEIPTDSTQEWLKTRQHQRDDQPFDPSHTVNVDQHLHFVRTIDFSRSTERGEGMLRALEMCREDAASHRNLDWEMLSRWQAEVLGTEVGFRTGDAFAKKGQERYPLLPSTPKKFKSLLEQANEDGSPVLLAARAYHDISCFHPFDDGNARSARLALEFVLAKNNLALIMPSPVFQLSRSANQFFQLYRTLICVVGRRDF